MTYAGLSFGVEKLRGRHIVLLRWVYFLVLCSLNYKVGGDFVDAPAWVVSGGFHLWWASGQVGCHFFLPHVLGGFEGGELRPVSYQSQRLFCRRFKETVMGSKPGNADYGSNWYSSHSVSLFLLIGLISRDINNYDTPRGPNYKSKSSHSARCVRQSFF